MENQFLIHKWSNPKELRSQTDDKGNIWFVAKDVCQMLGLSNPTEALRALDDDEKKICPQKLLGQMGEEIKLHGKQEINLVDESGLYTLIMRSNKPEAKKFRKWVTREVLPSIRKSGGYISPYAQFRESCIYDLDKVRSYIREGLSVRGDIEACSRATGVPSKHLQGYCRKATPRGMNYKDTIATMKWIRGRKIIAMEMMSIANES